MLKIHNISIDKLSTDPNNARKHSSKNLDAIKGSLKSFGQQKPIVIDENHMIVAGNGTYEAAKALKWDTIDCVVTGLHGYEKTAFALADNKSAELAEWDSEVLSKTLEALKDDIDLSELGFDLEEQPKQGNIDDDEIPEVEQNIHGVKIGDIWQLGEHRLMCGDSTDKASVEKLMNGEKADILFTSPPYNAGKFEPSGAVLEKFRKDNNKNIPKMTQKYANDDDNKTEKEYEDFLKSIINIGLIHSETVMLNIGLLEGCKRPVVKLIGEYCNQFKDIIFWNKKSSTPHIVAGIMTMIVEPIFCFGEFQSRKFPHSNFKGNFSNLIEGHNAAKDNEFSEKHSATFPVYLPEIIIDKFSEKSVLDLFMGTGTTIIAAEKTNRKCSGMEIDPHYCSVIIERWQKFTGKNAVKLETA